MPDPVLDTRFQIHVLAYQLRLAVILLLEALVVFVELVYATPYGDILILRDALHEPTLIRFSLSILLFPNFALLLPELKVIFLTDNAILTGTCLFVKHFLHRVNLVISEFVLESTLQFNLIILLLFRQFGLVNQVNGKHCLDLLLRRDEGRRGVPLNLIDSLIKYMFRIHLAQICVCTNFKIYNNKIEILFN